MQSSEPLRLATPACGSPIPDLANRDAPRGYLGQIYGSVACERVVPDVEGFHALALQRPIKPPLTEKEIGAKEKDVKRLRDRVGLNGWCRRYAGKMEQARILVQVLRRKN